MRLLPFLFQTKRYAKDTLKWWEQHWPRSTVFVMNAQSATSLYHMSLKTRKWLFLRPLQRKNPGGRAATLEYSLFSAWTAVRGGVCRVQAIFRSATMQTLNNRFRKSGHQEGREAELSKKSPLGKNSMLYFFSHPFPCITDLLKGNTILFPAI